MEPPLDYMFPIGLGILGALFIILIRNAKTAPVKVKSQKFPR